MDPGPLDIRDYLAIFWARKWTIVAVVVMTTAVALAYSFNQPRLYSSTAEVLVRAVVFDTGRSSTELAVQNMLTERQVANSRAVMDLTIERLNDDGITPGSMEAISALAADTLLFTSVASDPASAYATADAHAAAYLELRMEAAVSELRASRAPLDNRVEELDEQLQVIAERLQSARNEGTRAALSNLNAVLVGEQAALTQRLSEFATPASLRVGEVLRPAELPGAPIGTGATRNGVVGFVVGLALGVALALFRDRMDDRVRGRQELELHSGAPVLAFIPRISSRDPQPITLSDPTSEGAEAYQSLQVRLLHVAKQHSVKCVTITSSVPGEGKTSTTANLGVALAQAGKRVVLVSADLRRPRLQTYFRGEEGKGLTQVLLGYRTPMDVLSPTSVRNLWVIDTGPRSDIQGPLALLGSDAMRELLIELRGSADFVLVDTPPLLTSSDVFAIAPFTDGALFVADPRLVERPTVEQARHELQLIGVPVIGVVVNRYDPRWFRAYGSGYGDAYGDGPWTNGREGAQAATGRLTLPPMADVPDS